MINQLHMFRIAIPPTVVVVHFKGEKHGKNPSSSGRQSEDIGLHSSENWALANSITPTAIKIVTTITDDRIIFIWFMTIKKFINYLLKKKVLLFLSVRYLISIISGYRYMYMDGYRYMYMDIINHYKCRGEVTDLVWFSKSTMIIKKFAIILKHYFEI